MNNTEIFEEAIKLANISLRGNKKLIIVLGCLGDFDSIEYAQNLHKCLDKLIDSSIDLLIFGIGNDETKKRFAFYTGLPQENILVVKEASIHNKLGLCKGSLKTDSSYINLMLMCAGIDSPGTLKQVLRGYIGDCDSKAIFGQEKEQMINNIPIFVYSIYNSLNFNDRLRPLELATLRLINMIEILVNWKIYMPYPENLTQRGGTFFFNNHFELLYSYKPRSLLGYAQNMSKPLEFLDKWLILQK